MRRYGDKGLAQLLDLRTQGLNARDLFKTVKGLGQSWRLLGEIKPDIIFTRGGYISVPVAIAAKLRHIDYITHDSDSTPSLANRIIAPMAKINAVALSPDTYPYDASKTVQVGVPISAEFKPIDSKDRERLKTELKLEAYPKLLFVTGGGNGAANMNKVVMDNVPHLLKVHKDLYIVHVAGRDLAKDLSTEYDKILGKDERKRISVEGFVSDLYRYSGAADVIISRGGATNLSEFAAQGKACVIIPSPSLAWNVKNAHVLAKEHAIIYLSEDQAEQELRLASVVDRLLDDQKSREELSNKLAQYFVPDSAKKIAELIIRQVRKSE